MKRDKSRKKDGKWGISFAPIVRYSAVFSALILVIVFLGGGILSAVRMRSLAKASLIAGHAQVSQRVTEAINLLESLAGLPEFYDPEVPPLEKVKKLDQISPGFGYMMICYVDADIIVYSDGSEPASLASRDYMQRLFSTGQRQVTDSFAAGADGATLNYTVAVPLFDQQKNITGCLFCAIYFDEVVQILKQSAGAGGAEITLVGSQGQVMSSTSGLPYGNSVMEVLRSSALFGGATPDRLEEQLLAALPGDYWSFRDGSLYYTSYQRVENTGWDILCSVSFWTPFQEVLPTLGLVSGLSVLLCIGLLWLVRRYIAGQMKIVDTLVHSVEELEKRIYQHERPEEVDFQEVLRLTSNGLSDSLTGVVTRSVFLNQAASLMKKADAGQVQALCFVDMDNLKYINDSCGHAGGDIALKSVGYILREYEKKYDGVVGRYGGDEFVLLLTSLDDEKELRSVLDELVLRLKTEVQSGGQGIPVQCSVGVAVYRQGAELEQMIADADEALYYVKQNGKGYYHIHQK
ncbi:diguanylate cyclase [Anaerofilum sp. BX8]|uniref:Diguanylate cyclase n=1 Tax=Anaerofilum hominis TaxID=2763016 RepID=A0A923I4J6_9FIRM|nr:diguanylate cyclase [Anaerofilum hominis]MBC5580216.1 diguanylate cyclase [Anaerofilum hominis]